MSMKKLISAIGISFLLFSLCITAFAGSIPEDLLHDDNAELFFAEVVSYHPNKENPDIEIVPTKVIKGDVKKGAKLIYYNPNPVGDFKVKPGKKYLFTYFDEHNPTDIFDVTSYDTETLKLKNVTGDMWERLEQYLNEGRFLEAQQERIDRRNEAFEKTGKTITLTEYLGMDDISLGSIGIYCGPDAKEVDRDKFKKVADTIILSEINKTDTKIEGGHGIYISAPENMYSVYISSDCKVSKNNPNGDILSSVEYVIDSFEMAKLQQFFNEDEKWYFFEKANVKTLFYIVGMAFFGALAGVAIYKANKLRKAK